MTGSLADADEAKAAGLDVGFVCAGWPPDVGGVESHVRDLARALGTRGHRAHVLCLDTRPELQPFKTETAVVDGVEVRRMAYAYGDHDRLARVVSHSAAEDVVTAWMAETPCDLIHVHHLTGFGMGALAAIHDVGAPLVMTLHDYWPLCPRGQMLRNDGFVCATPEPDACAACLLATWPHLMPSATGVPSGPRGEQVSDDRAAAAARTAFALEMLELPARLFTPSEAARDVYVAAGVARERISVCENGVDVGALATEVAERRGERESGVVRLGVLGSVLPSKGVLELARAWARADAPGLALEVHGNLPDYHGDDSYVRALRALAEEHSGLSVHGPYAHDDLPAILARLDGVAAPSRWEEVFGLTVREARAAGLPVLVSDAGGLPAVVADGAAGLVVARDDEDAWVAALERFARDAESRDRWSRAETPVRSAREMMLELERAYVEVLVEATGHAPALVHEIEEARRPEPARRGFLARFLGRG